MTKQQTIDQIKNSLPGFYSAEQVIEMITKIEEPKATLDDQFINDFGHKFLNRLDRYPIAYVDLDSAEFDLQGNQIHLVDISIYVEDIRECAEEILGEMMPQG